MNLSSRIRIVWRRSKANINRLLGNAPPETPTAHGAASRVPYEIVEMITTHIAHDLHALKAFSLTCYSWYISAAPHLHRTFSFGTFDKLRPLSKLHRLGLMPLIKEILVEQYYYTWLAPQSFSRRDLHYFTAFANVQTLTLDSFTISRFIPGIERYFGHFSPTLRSLALLGPLCTPRQLSHFLSLFPNLDDIAIWEFAIRPLNTTISDTKLVPFSVPRLRGRLVLRGSNSVETWTGLIASGGGLRFRYMDLWRVGRCAPVLFEACADTLETLRFHAADTLVGE